MSQYHRSDGLEVTVMRGDYGNPERYHKFRADSADRTSRGVRVSTWSGTQFFYDNMAAEDRQTLLDSWRVA